MENFSIIILFKQKLNNAGNFKKEFRDEFCG